ncbi:DUF2066 domain-containing protein [Thalassotalea psychrophila]|uniref:DUF2066 domain-containing protein n=1 Tax=Thalassotalea psychrophila TaxID=3065647 RepID=A0ABY9TYK6_9GAMM|nr:DUF2066 domain-containing protein [Colwelliaceae bacterium SQ149]
MKTMKLSTNKAVSAFLLLIAMAFPVFAIEVNDLYQAQVLVDNTSTGKQKAAKQAFKQVLVKLAGEKFVRSNEQIKKALAKPNNYLSQFSYEQVENETFLLARFEQDKINQLLQKSKASVWGKYRPLMTIWMVEEDGIVRNVVDDSTFELKTLITDTANNRGLPVNFPLMDLTDSMNISVSDIWGRFPDTLQQASSRYLAEAVVVIRVSNSTLLEEPDITTCGRVCKKWQYSADWQYISQGEVIENKVNGDDKNQVIALAINDLAEHLHNNSAYVFSTEQQGQLDIEIANVNSMQAFVSVSEFLTNLTLVSDVKLISVFGEKMLFRLNILANAEAIKQSLKLEQKLSENHDPLAIINEDAVISFMWKG